MGLGDRPFVGVPTGGSLALALLAAVAGRGRAAAAASGCPTERHPVRAEARAGAGAGSRFDTRSARLPLRRVHATGAAPRAAAGCPRPRRPELAIPWRDATVRCCSCQLRDCWSSGPAGPGGRDRAGDDERQTRPAVDAVAALATYVAARAPAGAVAAGDRRARDAPRVLLRRDYGFVLISHAIVLPPAVPGGDGGARRVIPCALAGVAPEQAGAVALVAIVAGARDRPLRRAVGPPRRPRPRQRPVAMARRRPVGRWHRGRLAPRLAGRRDRARRRPLIYVARGTSLSSAVIFSFAGALPAPFALGAVLANSEA